VLQGDAPCPRDAALSTDESSTTAALTDTLDEAADHLGANIAQEYPHQPLGVRDLDTGKLHVVQTISVKLALLGA
jgi:hypothetical protein